MNKRGQFFLIAAIIIVGLVVGLASVANSIETSDSNEAFYDRTREISEETKHVFNHGIYQEKELDSIVQGYLENYTNEIAHDEVLFIYGDRDGVTGLIFEDTEGDVGINTGTIPGDLTIQFLTQQIAHVEYNPLDETNTVHVEIEGITYNFVLREGYNFLFVITDTENGERFVSTSTG